MSHSMLDNYLNLSNRDKAVMVGLFLSKYDRKALDILGFSSFIEAFNILGYSLQVSPNSVKNYRDEFDPYYPNNRKGWHHREILHYCKSIMETADNLSFETFYHIVNAFFFDVPVDFNDIKNDDTNTNKRLFSANRMLTGKAAEEYFVLNYKTIPHFQNYRLTDTTNIGCGFDYKLSLNDSNFYVEVKGINESEGGILMTEKEHMMAEILTERYCLFVVSNFRKVPVHQMFFDPLHDPNLSFQRQQRQIIQTEYSAVIPKT